VILGELFDLHQLFSSGSLRMLNKDREASQLAFGGSGK